MAAAQKKDAPAETPAETTPEASALQKGEHNPFLQGLLNEGKDAATAIKEWYETRDNLRTQARAAVSTGFCSEDQAAAVADLWPMPKRKAKDAAAEGETTAEETASAE